MVSSVLPCSHVTARGTPGVTEADAAHRQNPAGSDAVPGLPASGMTGTSVAVSVEHSNIPAMWNSTYHGRWAMLNGIPFNQLLFASDMTDWIFTARERFTPANGVRWADYIEWIGFTDIEELVTLDHMMCPELIDEPIGDDWSHNIQADYRTTWFHDLTHLRQRCDWRIGRDQIIAMIENPDAKHEPPNGFTHGGFDILDGYDSNSVLTNCGRFPDIIDAITVNSWGLLPTVVLANTIAERMRTEFPEDDHCQDCRVWQVVRDAELHK